MDRQQREAELRLMLTSQRGKEELLATLKRHAGLEGDAPLPPFGTLLVESILNYEYAPEDVPEGSGDVAGREPTEGIVEDPAEPGDVKLSEPPGREAPGG